MIVYVVIHDVWYESTDIIGIYATETGAIRGMEDYIHTLKVGWDQDSDLFVSTMNVLP